MLDLDSLSYPENRGNRQREVEAIYLPYKCGKVEAELIALRFFNHQRVTSDVLRQPSVMRLL